MIRSRSKSTREKKKITFTKENIQNLREKSIPATELKNINPSPNNSENKYDKHKFLENLQNRKLLKEEVISVRHFTELTKNYGGKTTNLKIKNS